MQTKKAHHVSIEHIGALDVIRFDASYVLYVRAGDSVHQSRELRFELNRDGISF